MRTGGLARLDISPSIGMHESNNQFSLNAICNKPFHLPLRAPSQIAADWTTLASSSTMLFVSSCIPMYLFVYLNHAVITNCPRNHFSGEWVCPLYVKSAILRIVARLWILMRCLMLHVCFTHTHVMPRPPCCNISSYTPEEESCQCSETFLE